MRRKDTGMSEIAAVANDYGWHYEVDRPEGSDNIRLTFVRSSLTLAVTFAARDDKIVSASGALNLTKSDRTKRHRVLAVLKSGVRVGDYS